MRRVALAVLSVLLAGACTSSSKAAGPTTTTAPPPPATWQGGGPPPASKLVAADGQVVYLGRDANALQLVSLDAATGAVSWQLPAAAPRALIGQRPSVLGDGGAVVALATATSVQSIDAHSGSVRWTAGLPGEATGNPTRCGDDVCITVAPAPLSTPPAEETTTTLPDAAAPALVALDRDDGHVTTVGREIGAAVVAFDGTNVLSIVGTDLLLARDRAREVVWRAPLASLVAPTGLPPEQLRWRAWPAPGDAWVVSSAPDGSTSLGVTTGVTTKGAAAWRITDSQPCPFLDDLSARDGDRTLPVLLCTGSPTRAVFAVDPLTGSATWQLDDPSTDSVAAPVIRTSDRSWLFVVQPLQIEVDVAEGPRQPGDDVAGGWCGPADPFPCTVDGAPVPLPAAVPAFAGVVAGGWGAWIDGGKVHAVQLP